MAIKPKKNRKYYLKCSNNFAADFIWIRFELVGPLKTWAMDENWKDFEAETLHDTLLEKYTNVPGNFIASNVPKFLPVMFLEFISDLPEKFRNITCEILELPSKKPETFLKN